MHRQQRGHVPTTGRGRQADLRAGVPYRPQGRSSSRGHHNLAEFGSTTPVAKALENVFDLRDGALPQRQVSRTVTTSSRSRWPSLAWPTWRPPSSWRGHVLPPTAARPYSTDEDAIVVIGIEDVLATMSLMAMEHESDGCTGSCTASTWPCYQRHEQRAPTRRDYYTHERLGHTSRACTTRLDRDGVFSVLTMKAALLEIYVQRAGLDWSERHGRLKTDDTPSNTVPRPRSSHYAKLSRRWGGPCSIPARSVVTDATDRALSAQGTDRA